MKFWIIFTSYLFLSQTDLSHAVAVSGIISGQKDVSIKAKSQGEITTIQIEEGQPVKEGDVIAIIDDRQEVIERNLATVEYTSAELDYENTKKLRKYVSKDEVEKKKNEFLKKKSVLELKEYNLDITKVISPISGVIAKRNYKLGETVAVGDVLVEVVQMDKLFVELDIYPKEASSLQKGQELEFSAETHDTLKFKGQVIYISPVVDASSGTVKVRLSLDNPTTEDAQHYVLKPGTMARFEL